VPATWYGKPISDANISVRWTGFDMGLAYAEVDDEWGGWDGGVTRIKHSPVTNTEDAARWLPELLPDTTAISMVTVLWRALTSSGGDSRIKSQVSIGGVKYEGAYHNLTTAYAVFRGEEYTLNPDTGVPWVPEDLLAANFEFGIICQSPAAFKSSTVDAVGLEVVFVGSPIPQEQVRDVASRHEWEWRRPKGMMTITVPLAEGLAVEVGDPVNVSHFAGPDAVNPGWRDDELHLRRFVCYSREVLPAQGMCRLLLREGRSNLLFYRDDAWCVGTAAASGDTIGRMGTGVTRTFTRDSEAFVKDPSSGLWVKVDNDIERHGYGGDYVEGGSRNKLLNSAFQDLGGASGWTKFGVGTNGSAIDIDSEDQFAHWDPESTGVETSLIITAGDPATVDTYIGQGTASSFGPNSFARAQLAYRNDTEGLLYVRIQRSSDSKYFRETDATFVAPSIWNPLPFADGEIVEWVSQLMTLNNAGNTLTINVGMPSATAVDGQIAHVYAVQIEQQAERSTWMLSDAAEFTREAEILAIQNARTRRSLFPAQWTMACEGISFWEKGAATGTKRTLAAIAIDVDNLMWWFYDPDAGVVTLRFRIDGVNYESSMVLTVYRGAVNRFVARGTGPAGEFGTEPYTIQTYANGLAGDQTVCSGPLNVGDDSSITWGMQDDGGNPWNGILRLKKTFQYVLSAEEAITLFSSDEV
jgi:hypothetical protein